MPRSSSAGISLRNWSSRLASLTVTCAPRDSRNSAAAMPDLPSPTTRTRLPLTSIDAFLPWSGPYFNLPQFQRGECKQCEDQRADPEAHNHLRLRPAKLLKVMVQRRHEKDALATQFERTHLQNHRERFQQESVY